MKIILAGCGKVGKNLTMELTAEGYDLIVIDTDKDTLAGVVERHDVMAVNGNCASMAVLRQAGVETADLLIAATASDEINLLCCVTAHGMNPKLHTIARIGNPEYAEQIYGLRKSFGTSMIFNPERQAAKEIERLIRYPGFLKRDTLAKGRLELVELKIEENSRLSGVVLSNLASAVSCKVLVCAVLRGTDAVIPRGDFVLQAGDRVFVTAPTESLSVLLRNLGIVPKKNRSVVIVGGGHISYYLAQDLAPSIDVKIIDSDPEVCKALSETLDRASIVLGDGTDPTLLSNEGLADADVMVSAMGLDEMNLITSLYAEKAGVDQVITKLGHIDNVAVLNEFPIGSIISPAKLCSDNIIRYIRALGKKTGAAISVHNIADGDVEVIEFCAEAGTRHLGEPLKNLKLKKNILIASIIRGTNTEIPGGNSVIELGDTLIVASSGTTVIDELNDIFAD